MYPDRKAAFTLSELLVVIGVIAVLAAILFPVFAQARDKARQAACLSNLRQIGSALQMYLQDYDERLPDACWYGRAAIRGFETPQLFTQLCSQDGITLATPTGALPQHEHEASARQRRERGVCRHPCPVQPLRQLCDQTGSQPLCLRLG